jgi:hypothetical protein
VGDAEVVVRPERAAADHDCKEGTEANNKQRFSHILRKVLCTGVFTEAIVVNFAGIFFEPSITSPHAKIEPVALDLSFVSQPRLPQTSPTIQSPE